MSNASLTVEYNLDNIEIRAFESLKSTLDLSSFDKIVQKAQENQAKGIEKQIENEVIVFSYEFLTALQKAQDNIRQAEVIANKLKQARHNYTSLLPKKRGKQPNWKNSFSENVSFTNNEGVYFSYNQAKDKMLELFNSREVREVYKKADAFNNKLIKMTQQGKELKTIISVLGSDGAPVLYEVDMEKFIDERMKFGYSSGKIASLAANFNVGSQAIADKLKSLKKIHGPEDNDNMGLRTTYIDVLERYKISGRRKYVMWKLSDQWHKAKIPTKGDLTEAYTLFYYSGQYKFNNGREENVDVFINQGVVSVDAVSGMYQGDVSLEKELYDYAIKQGNASFLELGQMVRLTEQILETAKNKGNIIELVMKEYQKEKDKNKDAIRTKICKVGGRQVSKAMKEFIKT